VDWGHLSTYDCNSLKPQIERAVQDETGREPVLGGQINLSLGLSPALVVDTTRMSVIGDGGGNADLQKVRQSPGGHPAAAFPNSLAVQKRRKSGKPDERMEYEGIYSKAIVKKIMESLG
jgi:hypothetical protein